MDWNAACEWENVSKCYGFWDLSFGAFWWVMQPAMNGILYCQIRSRLKMVHSYLNIFKNVLNTLPLFLLKFNTHKKYH